MNASPTSSPSVQADGPTAAAPSATPDAVEVSILGQTYILRTSRDGVATVRQAAARVDQEMSHIRDLGKIRARERTAVLAALNLAVELETAPPPATVDERDLLSQRDRLQGLISKLDNAIQSGAHSA